MDDYGTLKRHWLCLLPEAGIVAGGVAMVIQHDWFHLGTCIFTFTVSFAPLLFEKLLKVKLPSLFQLTYVLFVFASMFSGEVLRFYRLIPWWDAAMHFLSGILVGLGVILWLRALARKPKLFRMGASLQSLFIILFGIGIATLWEIVEFGFDQTFGTTSQDQSLYDTMTDLVYGAIGVTLLAAVYAFFQKTGRMPGLSQVIESFEKLNR